MTRRRVTTDEADGHRAGTGVTLEGPEIALRTPAAVDREDFLAAMSRSAELHHPWLYPPVTAAAFDAYLGRNADHRYASFLARRRSDDAIVGMVNVSEIVRGALQSAFIGYGGVAGHARRGYMTQALELLLGHAFTTMGLHRLEANVQPGNHASLALVRRLGFEREGFSPRYLRIGGRWRDHERWALREEDWGARTPG